MNRHTLFTKVQDYYQNLVSELATAQTNISMTFLAFDSGKWADEISQALIAQASQGVCVRLMVDEIGQVFDEPRHVLQNISLFNHLRSHGVQVDMYRPASPLKINNRLHCKFVAIDNRTVYLGGSNIGDYYTTWSDSNLRVDGELGNIFHTIYDFLLGFSTQGKLASRLLDISNLQAGTDRIWLTVPRHQYHIREALMNLINSADKSIYIRTWYFLPDEEMLNALCTQAKKGVQVNVLLSHETRVRLVDFANHIHVHKLVNAGGNVYRYTGKYMHSKVAWNNHDDVLFGSANVDAHSMKGNFESCLQINASNLTWELRHAFYSDLTSSVQQTPHSYLHRSFADKALTHTCYLASDWL
jgi:cardiolipin synthase